MPNNKYPMVVSFPVSPNNGIAATPGDYLKTQTKLHVTYKSADHAAFLLYLSGDKSPEILAGACRYLETELPYIPPPPPPPEPPAQSAKINDETQGQLNLF